MSYHRARRGEGAGAIAAATGRQSLGAVVAPGGKSAACAVVGPDGVCLRPIFQLPKSPPRTSGPIRLATIPTAPVADRTTPIAPPSRWFPGPLAKVGTVLTGAAPESPSRTLTTTTQPFVQPSFTAPETPEPPSSTTTPATSTTPPTPVSSGPAYYGVRSPSGAGTKTGGVSLEPDELPQVPEPTAPPPPRSNKTLLLAGAAIVALYLLFKKR